MNSYIIASVGEWNKELFEKSAKMMKGNWFFCSSPSELNELLKNISPRYIFFPHWRWIVPQHILDSSECICFHMTDVPYGRGGSPLQNLIVRGHKKTVLTALRMEASLDTGPVYFKKPLSIEGPAHEIYQRAAELSWQMIRDFAQKEPSAVQQEGEVVIFKRRTPEESEIPNDLSLEETYNYIRMLDAPGYPNAFIEFNKYILEFEKTDFNQGELTANVKIKMKG